MLVLAVGCGGTQVKSVTGPGGAPAYAISCNQDRGLCYKEAYNTCRGGYYILDSGAVNRGTTGRNEAINQDRPGRAAQDHSLLVQCTGDSMVDPLLADVGTDRGRYPYARYAAPATRQQAATVQDPLLGQLSGSTTGQVPGHTRTVLPPAQPNKKIRSYTYGGDPYANDPTARDPYGTDSGYTAPYAEGAVPPYPGYRGNRYSRSWGRKKYRRKKRKKAAKAKPAPAAKQSGADCACP